MFYSDVNRLCEMLQHDAVQKGQTEANNMAPGANRAEIYHDANISL